MTVGIRAKGEHCDAELISRVIDIGNSGLQCGLK